MAAPFPNHYVHRKVAESAAKACDVCYIPSTSVLITPDQKDFFYVCPIHLKDTYFCAPKVDEEAVKARREKELAEEKDKLMKEYEERKKKKKKSEQKVKDKKEEEKPKEEEKEKEQEQEKEVENENPPPKEEEPREFELKRPFYQQRLVRKRQAEAAKRDREKASQPNYFPSVPSLPPGR